MFKKKSPVRTKNTKIKRRVIDPKKIMLIKQLVIGLLVFSTIGLLITGLWYLTRIQSMNISVVTVEGGETISHQQVENKVNEVLEGSYIGLIPRRFAWWYPHDQIISKIVEVPRMKNPNVERVSGTELKITFDEYSPYALWCVDRNSENCLFIDKAGYAFAPSPKLTGGAFLRFHTIGTEPKVGTTMVQISDVQKMEEFVDLSYKNLDLPIDQIETDSAGDVFYILAGGGELKATLKDESSQVLDNLRAILASKEFSHIKPGNFQYIDLRFGNKVFVNEEKFGVASSSDASIEAVKDAENKKATSSTIQ